MWVLVRSFLVLFNDLPIDKASVKRGENGPEVVTAARCVNVGLFLSNALRRDVEVIIGIVREKILDAIRFRGETLRRVSPDERSIAFFLLKATTALEEMVEGSSLTMDNGIELSRTTLEKFLSEWPVNQTCVASDDADSTIQELTSTDGLFIYPFERDSEPMLGKCMSLKRSRTPERFILDINVNSDRKN